MEEEGAHPAQSRVAAWTEVSVDEGSCIATSVRHGNPVAMRIKRSLGFTGRERNDEVALHSTSDSTVNCAWGVCRIARPGARACHRHKTSILELLNDSDAARVSEHGEVSGRMCPLPSQVHKTQSQANRLHMARSAVSGAAVVDGSTSVVKSMVENKSSPTVLMRAVTGLTRGVLVVSPFGIPTTVDNPLIPVTSSAAIVRTDSFLRFIIFVFIAPTPVIEYMECYIWQYFLDSTISRFDIIQVRNIIRDCKLEWDWKVYTSENLER